jgi:hypothetical protein
MLAIAAAAWEDLQAKSCASTMDILNLMLATAAVAWAALQAKSCASTMNILNLILLNTL